MSLVNKTIAPLAIHKPFTKIYKVFPFAATAVTMKGVYLVVAAIWIVAVVSFYFFFTIRTLLPYFGGG